MSLLEKKITTFTMELGSSRNYIELPTILNNVQFIRIRHLYYTKITDGQRILLIKMATGSGLFLNRNHFFTSSGAISCAKSIFLGPTNSITLFDAPDSEVYTIKLEHPEPIATLTIDFLIDSAITTDISPSNLVIITIDFIE
jgi:hypothetical protein